MQATQITESLFQKIYYININKTIESQAGSMSR